MHQFHEMRNVMTSHEVTGGQGVQLHVVETGNARGRPIIFIHGVSQCWLQWSRQMDSRLVEDHRLVALDMRGHGLSEKPRVGYDDSKQWADDVHGCARYYQRVAGTSGRPGMTRTFLDSGVLLTAWKGKADDARAALSIMEDERREFYSAQMMKLESLPKPSFHRQRLEVEFYNAHFKTVRREELLSQELGAEAFRLATRYGLAAADALNVAAAIRMGVEEFTTETPGKPLFSVSELQVTSLHAARRV